MLFRWSDAQETDEERQSRVKQEKEKHRQQQGQQYSSSRQGLATNRNTAKTITGCLAESDTP